MKFGILFLAAGLLFLYSHPLNWIGSATFDYFHTVLIGFTLVGVGLGLIARKPKSRLVIRK